MPVRRELAERLPRLRLAIVEGGVEPELVEPRDLLRRPGAADRTRAANARQLRCDAPHGSGRTGDEDGVVLSHAADVVDPDVRGETGHAEHAERGRDGRNRRIDRAHAPPVEHRGLAPAEVVLHPRALRPAIVARGDDLPHRAAAQRLAEGERRDVGLGVVHPTRACTDRPRRRRCERGSRRRRDRAVPPRRARNPMRPAPRAGGRQGGSPATSSARDDPTPSPVLTKSSQKRATLPRGLCRSGAGRA